MKQLCITLCTGLLAAMPVVAETGDHTLQLSPRVGLTRIEIDANQVLTNDATTVGAAGIGVTLGYVSPVGLLIEGGANAHGNFSLFGADDEYALQTYTAALGFQFETPRGFRIIPKVGRMRWKLRGEEGAFANPGPEEARTLRGYTDFWEVTLAKKLRSASALGLTFQERNFAFGNVRSLAFTMNFDL